MRTMCACRILSIVTSVHLHVCKWITAGTSGPRHARMKLAQMKALKEQKQWRAAQAISAANALTQSLDFEAARCRPGRTSFSQDDPVVHRTSEPGTTRPRTTARAMFTPRASPGAHRLFARSNAVHAAHQARSAERWDQRPSVCAQVAATRLRQQIAAGNVRYVQLGTNSRDEVHSGTDRSG